MPGTRPARAHPVPGLKRKLPYGFTDEGDLDAGLVALDHLLQSVGPQYTTPILSQLLLAPCVAASASSWRVPALRRGAHRLIQDDRGADIYGAYGPRFLQDDALLKWGRRSNLQRHSETLPPLRRAARAGGQLQAQHRRGARKAFTNLVHNIARVQIVCVSTPRRIAPHKGAAPFAHLHRRGHSRQRFGNPARLLLVRFLRQDGGCNAHLAAAHESAEHLQTIGMAWLEWLEDEVHRKAASTLRAPGVGGNP